MKFLTIGQNVRLVCVQFDRYTIWILDLVFVEKNMTDFGINWRVNYPTHLTSSTFEVGA